MAKNTIYFLIGLLFIVGCHAGDGSKKVLFAPHSDTIPGILTPTERTEMIRMKGEYGRNSDLETQKELLEQLAEEYVNSPDSLVRQEVVMAAAKISSAAADKTGGFDMELSKGFDLVKYAAMHDEDPFVRREACRVITGLQRPETAIVLRHVARNDLDKDVQLQAIQGLKTFDDKDTIETLGQMLNHRQPALRYEAMQSLKVCTKQNFGDDVYRWKQYLAGETPDAQRSPSLAERLYLNQLPMFN
jgi:FOG: HEAT repeat